MSDCGPTRMPELASGQRRRQEVHELFVIAHFAGAVVSVRYSQCGPRRVQSTGDACNNGRQPAVALTPLRRGEQKVTIHVNGRDQTASVALMAAGADCLRCGGDFLNTACLARAQLPRVSPARYTGRAITRPPRSYRIAFRHPAAIASSSLQNQRLAGEFILTRP
jgi:hypothetical protein